MLTILQDDNLAPCQTIHHCTAIGIPAIDRERKSCRWRTKYCTFHCYNNPLYRRYAHTMVPYESKLRTGWKQWSVESTRRYLESKRDTPSRLRLCTRGEPIAYKSDIDKILHIADRMPGLQFWIPTRAWRNPQLRRSLESRIIRKSNVRHNVRLQASLDPSNTSAEWKSLVGAGWSTMFFGHDAEHPLGNAVKCPKTWESRHGHCAVCRVGCFRMGQTHIWLKKH